jgi:hypothetical protein
MLVLIAKSTIIRVESVDIFMMPVMLIGAFIEVKNDELAKKA